MEQKAGWAGRTHGGKFGQKALFVLFRFINLSFGYAILSFVVVFYMIFNRKGYNSIWFYFRKIQGFGFWKSFWYSYRNHFIFGQTLLDKFALFAGQRNVFKITISGQEHFDSILNSPNGAIIASSHVGNFEISGYLLSQTQKRINGIIFGGENPVIQQYRDEILSKNNVSQIPISSDLSHIFKINQVLKNGEIVSMPCDRAFSGTKIAQYNFFGRLADFPTGAYHLAVKFNVPLLTLFVMKDSAKHYHVHLNKFEIPADSSLTTKEKVDLLGRAYVSELERILKMYPVQWFNYFKFWN